MANQDAPRGLHPVRQQSPGCSAVQNGYPIKSGYGGTIWQGDPVILAADGTLEKGTAAGIDHIGIFNGVKFVDEEGEQQFKSYWSAGTVATEIEASVYDDPTTIFLVQATTATQADVGDAHDLIIAAGTPATGVSKTVLNQAAAVGAAYRIESISKVADNEEGAFCDVHVISVKNARS